MNNLKNDTFNDTKSIYCLNIEVMLSKAPLSWFKQIFLQWSGVLPNKKVLGAAFVYERLPVAFWPFWNYLQENKLFDRLKFCWPFLRLRIILGFLSLYWLNVRNNFSSFWHDEICFRVVHKFGHYQNCIGIVHIWRHFKGFVTIGLMP